MLGFDSLAKLPLATLPQEQQVVAVTVGRGLTMTFLLAPRALVK
jgi:hypothetical protein